MKALLLLVAIGSLALAGCASFNKRLEVSTVRKIRPQATTRADVEQLIGHPKETVTGANGITVARYFFKEFHRSTDVSWKNRRENPGDILFRTLTIAYNASNIVQRKLHDESVTPIYRTNAWFFAGPELKPETVGFIKRDATTGREAIEKLGEPSSRTFDGEGRTVLLWFNVKTRETTWSNPDVQRLMALLDERGTIHDYVLVEHALSEFEPLTLH
jgi:hypothetical protein